jgi:hypothetical protein
MKRLTGALLVLGIFVSIAPAQSAEQIMKNRRKVLFGWIGIVRAAESKYKSEHGIYGDLNALRGARLLDALVFSSDELTEIATDTNIVPNSTHVEVTASSDGNHFKVEIYERLDVGSVGVFADETGGGSSQCRPLWAPIIEDEPQGPSLSLAG